MEVGKERRGWVSVVAVLCLASALVLLSVSSTVKKNELGEQDIRSSSADQHIRGLAQSRHLTGSWGPGSYPPRCAAKCGDCSPCSPVHVPVPPGTPVTTEYYPEAWRCKCGNKLYMP